MSIKQKIKRAMLVGGSLMAVGAATVGGLGVASAATTTNPQASLVDKLVAKFNLNKDEVQKVFDEEHAAREAEHQQDVKDRLDALVKDGKITQDQEDKLIAKGKELQTQREANRDAMKDKTNDERKAAMDAERDAFKKWLNDNGIAEEYGRIIMGGHGHGRGPGEMRKPDGPPPADN